MPTLRRGLLTVAVSLAGLAVSPAAASAGCAYDAATHTLSITERSNPVIKRSGTSIVLVHETCAGQPTVLNTDTIAVTGGLRSLTVDLSGGQLAPGFTPESDGTPEIELIVNSPYGLDLFIYSSAAGSNIRVGGSGADERINLNADEASGDADITFTNASSWVWFLASAGATGNDTFDARGGAGTGAAHPRWTYVVTGPGNDAVHAGTGGAKIDAGTGDDTLSAVAGPTEMYGREGNDTMVGGSGDDRFHSAAGDDTIDGSAGGFDALSFNGDTNRLVRGVKLDLQDTGPQATGNGVDTISGIESASGANYDDVLRGSAGPETLNGGLGNDVLAGRGGDDRIEGGPGLGFTDVAAYGEARTGVTVDLSKDGPQPTGGAGNDTLVGIESLTGTPYADWLTASDDAASVLNGHLGADHLVGGPGYDMLVPGTGPRGGSDGAADTVDGGPGDDTISYGARSFAVAVTLDGLRNDGADPNRDGISSAGEEGDVETDVEVAIGGRGADRLTAHAPGRQELFGGPGADFLDARDATPEYDSMQCGAGTDTYRIDSKDGAWVDCETAAP